MFLEPKSEKQITKDETRQIGKPNILWKARMNTWLKQISSEEYQFPDIDCSLP